jgi:hypothetical protein
MPLILCITIVDLSQIDVIWFVRVASSSLTLQVLVGSSYSSCLHMKTTLVLTCGVVMPVVQSNQPTCCLPYWYTRKWAFSRQSRDIYYTKEPTISPDCMSQLRQIALR